MPEQVIFYQFTRPAIEEGDFSNFISRFDPEVLPRGRQLADMMNGLATFVQGYDFDMREVYAIPEIRSFYNRLVSAWPYWLYFSNLETDGLRVVALCYLKSLNSISMKGNPAVQVTYDPSELLDFLARHLGPMNEMCDRAGLSEKAIFQRTKRVFEYFDLPFEADFGSV
jgi:hypothetical protein